MRADPNVLGRPKPSTSPARAGARLTPQQRHAALTEQSGKWVAQTFFGQMLKQMRDGPFKDKLFSGGRGGEAFQQMADQRTAEHLARGSGRKLVNSIVHGIEAKSDNVEAKRARVGRASAAYQSAGKIGRDRGVA